MSLPVVIAAFAVGFGLGLSSRVVAAVVTWLPRVLVVVAVVAVVQWGVLVVRGGPAMVDAGSCRVDAEGILIDPEACAAGQSLVPELYGLTAIASVCAVVGGMFLARRTVGARRGRLARPER